MKKDLALLNTFSFVKNLQFFGALAVPFYTERIGFSFTQIFSLEAVFSIALFLFEIPTGVVADKYGRKTSLLIGSLFFGLAFVGYGFTYSFFFLVLFQITAAFGMSLISGADKALVYEKACEIYTDKKDITAITGRYDAIGTAGMLLAFPAGTLLTLCPFFTFTFALGLVFVISGISSIISGFIVIFVNEKKRPEQTESSIKIGLDGFLLLFSTSSLRRISVNTAFIGTMTFLMFWLYQSILQFLSFPVSAFGFIAAGFNGAGMILLLFLSRIQKKVSNSAILFVTSFGSAALYLISGLYPSLFTALLAIFGITMFRFFRSPILLTIINTNIPDSKRATVLSGLSMLERIITTLCYFIVGILSDISIPLTFVVIGLITLLISVCMPITKKHL